MTEEQAMQLLITLFGFNGAADLTELESGAAGVLVSSFDWPITDVTDEQLIDCTYLLHGATSASSLNCRAAIDSVIAKAKAHAQFTPS